MKLFLALLLVTTSLASGRELKVGDSFPRLTLPSIDTAREVEVDALLGEKLMLHLFASW